MDGRADLEHSLRDVVTDLHNDTWMLDTTLAKRKVAAAEKSRRDDNAGTFLVRTGSTFRRSSTDPRCADSTTVVAPLLAPTLLHSCLRLQRLLKRVQALDLTASSQDVAAEETER